MKDLFNALAGPSGSDLSMVLVFLVVGATVVGIFALIQWRNIEQRRMDTSLKREMLERGMSADDIVRVIEASQTNRESVDAENTLPRPTTSTADQRGISAVS
jgi:hypothetical protein